MSDTVVLHLSQSDAMKIYCIIQHSINFSINSVNKDLERGLKICTSRLESLNREEELLNRYRHEIYLNS